MILAIDVHYKEHYAKCVGVLFNWGDTNPVEVKIEHVSEIAPYVPGEFYKRELPCLLAVIDQVDKNQLEAIVVDGHVYVDNERKHGLGGYLWEALNEEIPVIGVAKRAFHNNDSTNCPVLRGESKNPLYVSAIGMALDLAVSCIQNMKGDYRMPTLLQVLDTATKKDD